MNTKIRTTTAPAAPTVAYEVPFQKRSIVANYDGEAVWVDVPHICESLGMSFAEELERLTTAPWIVSVLLGDRFCIDLECLPLWLATVDPEGLNAVNRKQLVHYQRDAAADVREWIFGSPVPLQEADQLLMETVNELSVVDLALRSCLTREATCIRKQIEALVQRLDRYLGLSAVEVG